MSKFDKYVSRLTYLVLAGIIIDMLRLNQMHLNTFNICLIAYAVLELIYLEIIYAEIDRLRRLAKHPASPAAELPINTMRQNRATTQQMIEQNRWRNSMEQSATLVPDSMFRFGVIRDPASNLYRPVIAGETPTHTAELPVGMIRSVSWIIDDDQKDASDRARQSATVGDSRADQ